jgi:hypothetical protein
VAGATIQAEAMGMKVAPPPHKPTDTDFSPVTKLREAGDDRARRRCDTTIIIATLLAVGTSTCSVRWRYDTAKRAGQRGGWLPFSTGPSLYRS